MTNLFFSFAMSSIRIFYRDIRVVGLENLPDGPVIVVGNHPNGLVDPVVVRIALKRKIAFLAKSTLFGNPIGRATMVAVNAIPVYRPKDGSDTSKNDVMFQACYDNLNEGVPVVLFPEGTSHSDPQMKRLKTGAARIALGAEAATEGLNLQIVPLGLFYEAKQTFRSRLSIRLGEPLSVADYMADYAADQHDTARALTNEIGDRMSEVVLEAETGELWKMFVQLAKWTDEESETDITKTHAYAKELASGYQRLTREDPSAADNFAQRVLLLDRLVDELGVQNPLELENLQISLPGMVAFVSPMIVFAPFAFIGLLSGWLPYKAFGPLAQKLAGSEFDLLGTMKVIVGMVFMPLIWAAQASVLGYFLGWQIGVLAGIALPLCGFVAVRYEERILIRKSALQARWLRLTRREITAQIEESRRQLSHDIQEALKRLGEE